MDKLTTIAGVIKKCQDHTYLKTTKILYTFLNILIPLTFKLTILWKCKATLKVNLTTYQSISHFYIYHIINIHNPSKEDYKMSALC